MYIQVRKYRIFVNQVTIYVCRPIMEILKFLSHNHAHCMSTDLDLKTLARAILSLQVYQLLYMLIGSAIVHADAPLSTPVFCAYCGCKNEK